MSTKQETFLRIHDFEWDEANALHLQLGHGIAPEEAEEVFANNPFFRRTKKGHYAVFGPTFEGRYLTVVFELKPKGIARPFTGWDMSRAEIQYYETFEKCSILVKVKEGDNFNHPRGIGFAFHGAGRNILNISRIKI